MEKVTDCQMGARAYKDCSTEPKCGLTYLVEFDKDELYNLIEFIEFEFIDMVRDDTEIDNIDYIVSMMSALKKLRLAYQNISQMEQEKGLN